MLRTKHAFIGLMTLLAIFTGVLGSSFVHVPEDPFGFRETQSASVIEAEEQVPEVIVLKDTSREDARALLRERLKAFIHESDPVDGDAEARGMTETTTLDAPDPEPIPAPKSILCNPNASPISIADWGPIDTFAAEGVRVIHTIALGPDGLPLRVLQLPLEPRVTGMTACLPNGQIAVLRDGTAVTPEESIEARNEGVVGYAIDGFPLMGLFEEGKTVTNADLDVCHGHTHAIVDQGTLVSMYHYHTTEDAPYTLGCLRGTPVIE